MSYLPEKEVSFIKQNYLVCKHSLRSTQKKNMILVTNSDHTCNQADNTTQYNLRPPFKDNSLHIALYYHLTKNKSLIINQPYEIVSRNQVSLQTH